MKLYSIINGLVIIVFFIFSIAWIWGLIQCVLDKIKRKDVNTKELFMFDVFLRNNPIRTNLILIASLVIFITGSTDFKGFVGYHNINHLVDGTHCYYGELVSEDNDRYTLPCEIEVTTEEQEYNERTETIRRFCLNRAFFDDGSFLDFTDSDYMYLSKITKPFEVRDETGTYWQCTLLNEHAYCREVSETPSYSMLGIILFFLMLVIILFNWIGSVVVVIKDREKE